MCWSTSVKRSTVDIYLSDPQPCWWNLCSWLILDTSIHLTFASFFLSISLTLLAMAASSANKMEHPAPNWDLLQTNLRDDQIQWSQVREYLYQRFTSPPSSFLSRQGQTLVSNVEPQEVCDHIRRCRPCPSFWDPSTTCNRYHPEFLLRGGRVIWTPRTWACHAFQRRTDHHQHGTCQHPGCMQLHRPGWEHTEIYAFRLWMRQSNSRLWFSVWHELPNIDGKKPLWTLKYQDVHECLTTQPFLESTEYEKQDWQCGIPSPLTYIQDVHSRVQPLEPNWNEPERVQRRREFRRSLTPRSMTPRRPRDDQPAQPAQPSHGATTPRFSHGTPPRSRHAQFPPAQPSQPAPAPFLQPTTPQQPSQVPTTANLAQSYSSPQPIPHPLQQPVQPPSRSYQLPVDPTPPADDAWGTYTNTFTSGSDTPPSPSTEHEDHCPSQLGTYSSSSTERTTFLHQLLDQPDPKPTIPRFCCPDVRRALCPLGQLADANQTPRGHLEHLEERLLRPQLPDQFDLVWHFVQAAIIASWPTILHRADVDHSFAYEHRWPRTGHSYFTILCQNELGTISDVHQ